MSINCSVPVNRPADANQFQDPQIVLPCLLQKVAINDDSLHWHSRLPCLLVQSDPGSWRDGLPDMHLPRIGAKQLTRMK